MENVRVTDREGQEAASHRARPGPFFRAFAALALPAILLPGCASTGCKEWGTRVETVRVCNDKYAQCTFEEQPVPYCLGTSARRTAAAATPEPRQPARPQQKEARAPEGAAPPPASPRPEPRGETRAPGKFAKTAPTSAQAKESRPTKGSGSSGAPDLDRFWRSLYSASRYSGLRYGPVREAIRDPATMPASSAEVVTALRKNVSTVVSMEIASDRNFTPMDHRLSAVVYQAHNAEAATALYTAIVREEWKERKRLARRGVKLIVVNTSDKNKPGSSGQRIHLMRGSYVLDVHEWKSIYRDSKGKPVPGKQFPHSHAISPDVVAKAVIRTFPAE